MSTIPPISNCPGCGTQLGPAMRACPACGQLIYGDQLTALAASAEQSQQRGDTSGALSAWREALDLLPTDSRQHQVIVAKITELGRGAPLVASPQEGKHANPAYRAAAGAGAIGLLLWKLKALALGLTKSSTFFSMLLSLGVYWTMWGWQFALGIILSIYVHEMGHVFALRRYGFKATAPMFIPGLGALIRLTQQVVNPREDAVIGLAGPLYGLAAALVSLALWGATGEPIFAAIAGVGAWINLFNLMPLGTLDGGRAFHAMSKSQRLLAAALMAGGWLLTSDGLLLVLALVGLGRGATDKTAREGDRQITAIFCLLVVALTAVASVRTWPGMPQ